MLLSVQLQFKTFLTTYIFVSLWNGLSAIQAPEIQVLRQRGIKFTITDDGYDFINLLYNKNKPIGNRKDIQWRISMKKSGKLWRHVNQNVTVLPGDKIYYEVNGRKGAYGEVEILTDVYILPKQKVVIDRTKGKELTHSTVKDHYSDEDSSNDDDEDIDDDTVYIVIGVILGVALTAFLVFLLWYYIRRKRMRSNDRENQGQSKQPSVKDTERKRNEIEAVKTSDSARKSNFNTKTSDSARKSNFNTAKENKPTNSDHSENDHTYDYIGPEYMDMQVENKNKGYAGLSKNPNTKTENEEYEKLRHPQYLEVIG